jgi:hypothetical protein
MSDLLDQLLSDNPVETEAPAAETLPVPKTPNGPPAIFLGQGSKVHIVGGLEDFTPAQLNLEPPRLRIVQKVKREEQEQGFKLGQWRLGAWHGDVIEVVFVRAHPGRMFLEGDGADARVYCASDDNKVPHETVAEPKDQNCGICFAGKWTNRPDGKRVPPPCQEFVAMLGVVPELDHKPFWYAAQKTARTPAMEFCQFIQKQYETGAEHLAQYLVRLTTVEQEKGGVNWYTPLFTVSKELAADTYRELYDQARGLRYLPRLSQTAQGGSDGEVVASPGEAAAEATADEMPF